MALISLVEWAKRNGIDDSTARKKADKGLLPAMKIGRNWVIEESTPNTDCRQSGISRRWKKDE